MHSRIEGAPQRRQRLTVLGSTGSIGRSTLDVLGRHPDRWEVFALSAATRVDLMLAQCVQWRPRFAVMRDPDAARALAHALEAERIDTVVETAPDALERIASHPDVDAVMAAIVGAAGLPAVLAAAHAGKRLLLANKEALVVAGALLMQAVRASGASLLPIDSEHSAIFQALPEDPATWSRRVERIILTASGGPFRGWPSERLRDVTPQQACKHPNWDMGRKISVDSATMMNKALEVIEARWLFDLPPERIAVVIHPQSVVHSMVEYRDGSVLAQLGTPDMRVPIACGLAWPERIESGAARLDFATLGSLTFEPADCDAHRARFPGLRLAWEALAGPTGTTAVLNAANEVAVESFLQGCLRFDQIHAVNQETLAAVLPCDCGTLRGLLELDAQARRWAQAQVRRLAPN